MAVKIALDARTVFSTRRRGTGKNLLDAYRAMADLRPEWQFYLYHRSDSDPHVFHNRSNVLPCSVEMPGDRWELWEQLRLPIAAGWDGASLLHCPANSCPAFSFVPIVSTIHDLIPLKLSDESLNGTTEVFARKVRRCLERSRRVIAVSNSTKMDLVSEFGADPDRIDVISWACDSAYEPVSDPARLELIRPRYNINGRYMLAFSGRSRRKNAEGMIRAYALLPDELRREVQFLLIGVEPQSQRDRLTLLGESLGLSRQCQIFGFVPEEDIPALLSGAEFLAFCSLYEGFGLPILDAFCCRTPVLTSRVSSMPEVAGHAAEYCDPADPESIATGMARLLTDAQRRSELVRSGLERLKYFSWWKTAEQICQVFEKCL